MRNIRSYSELITLKQGSRYNWTNIAPTPVWKTRSFYSEIWCNEKVKEKTKPIVPHICGFRMSIIIKSKNKEHLDIWNHNLNNKKEQRRWFFKSTALPQEFNTTETFMDAFRLLLTEQHDSSCRDVPKGKAHLIFSDKHDCVFRSKLIDFPDETYFTHNFGLRP